MNDPTAHCLVPLIVCAEFDSPVDALLSLCVAHDEAMDLVAASWREEEADCVATTVDGGRAVAVLRLPNGRWAACNAYPSHACANRHEAERRLAKLRKRHQRGLLGLLTAGECRALLPPEG